MELDYNLLVTWGFMESGSMSISFFAPIALLLLGAIIGYYSSSSIERKKRLATLVSVAYTDFLSAYSTLGNVQDNMCIQEKKIANLNPNDKEYDIKKFKAESLYDYYFKEHEQSISKMADAKARIGIYGRKESVEQIADVWYDLYKTDPSSSNYLKLFIKLCQLMRNDTSRRSFIGKIIHGENDVADKSLLKLLFGVDSM